MYKELLTMIKKSKSCFVWCNVYQEDGEYLQANKSVLNRLVKNTTDLELLKGLKNTFTLREDGDLYVN
jgi:hypothetical protein